MNESKSSEDVAANTDRELWREGGGDGSGMSYYKPSIHVTKFGGIGINVDGYMFVKTLREWHRLAAQDAFTRAALPPPKGSGSSGSEAGGT